MKNNFPKDGVNRRIADTRTSAHLTQAEMAERLNVNRSTYAYMERHGKPTPERIAKIAEILNVSVDFLVNGEKPSDVTLHDSVEGVPQQQPSTFQLTESEKRVIRMLRMLPHSEAAKIKSELKDKFEEIFIKK